MRSSSLLLVVALFGSCGSSQPSQSPQSTATPLAPPRDAEALGVEWRSAQIPGLGTVQMAVARPAGEGPFPAVIILHGSHGFSREYIQLAKELSRDGIVAVVPCWFAPGEGEGMRFISPIDCPAETPHMAPPLSRQATRNVDLVVRAARTLPGVETDRIALFGHSRGGGAAWNYVLQGGSARAVILNSAGYTDELIQRASEFESPVLILHGDKDGPADGGGIMTKASRARAFQRALRRGGKPVEATYYPAGRHNSLFASPAQRADEVRRMKAFLHQYLLDN